MSELCEQYEALRQSLNEECRLKTFAYREYTTPDGFKTSIRCWDSGGMDAVDPETAHRAIEGHTLVWLAHRRWVLKKKGLGAGRWYMENLSTGVTTESNHELVKTLIQAVGVAG
jgi:hypothetical protein